MNLDLRARSVTGDIRNASLKGPAPLDLRRSKSHAKAAGLRYERQLGQHLSEVFPGQVSTGDWWTFEDERGPGRCQTDATVRLPDGILIVEAKSSHTLSAWHQLTNLYGPVVAAATGRPVILLEATRSHDPAVKWPDRYKLLLDREELETWLLQINPHKERHLGVYVWRR